MAFSAKVGCKIVATTWAQRVRAHQQLVTGLATHSAHSARVISLDGDHDRNQCNTIPLDVDMDFCCLFELPTYTGEFLPPELLKHHYYDNV